MIDEDRRRYLPDSFDGEALVFFRFPFSFRELPEEMESANDGFEDIDLIHPPNAVSTSRFQLQGEVNSPNQITLFQMGAMQTVPTQSHKDRTVIYSMRVGLFFSSSSTSVASHSRRRRHRVLQRTRRRRRPRPQRRRVAQRLLLSQQQPNRHRFGLRRHVHC